MMPKGVEHTLGELVGNITALVKIPMMPKGVEHFVELDWTPGAMK